MNKKKIRTIAFIIAFLIAIFAFLKWNSETRRMAEIRGIDADKNGIRDDVDVFIKKEVGNSKKLLLAASQMAKVFQQAIEHPEWALATSEALVKAHNCFKYLNVGLEKVADLSEKLEAETANSPERARAYLQFNVNLSGTMIKNFPTEKTTCNFNTENLSDE